MLFGICYQFCTCIFFIIYATLFFFVFFLSLFLLLFLTLYFLNSKLYSRFLIYAFWYLLSILYRYFLYNFCDFVCFCFFLSLSLFFFFFFLTLYFWNSKLYSRFLTFAFWYLLSILNLYFLYNFHNLVCFCLFVFSLFLFLLLFFNIVFLKFQTLL